MREFLMGEVVLLAVAGAIIAMAFPPSSWGPRPRLRPLIDRITRELDGSTSRQRLVWIALIVIALASRLYHMSQTMRGDEAYTFLRYASLPLRDALSDYSDPNNHFFHTLLVRLSTSLFGTSPAAIRLPAFVAGMLIVPAVYVVARRVADRNVSLVAMALAAVWPALVLYSTNARGHAIVALVFLVLLVLADDAIDRDDAWRWLVIAGLIAIGMYTAPIMLYPAGAAMLWILVEKTRREGFAAALAMVPRLVVVGALAGVFTAMLLLPVMLRSGITFLLADRRLAALSPRQLVAAMPAFAGQLVESHGVGIPRPLLVLLAVAGIAGMVAPSAERPRRLRLALTVLLWCLVLLVATRRPPPGRAWHFLVPLACVYVAIGTSFVMERLAHSLGWRPARLTFAAAAVLVVAISGYTVLTRAVFRSPESGTLIDAPQIADYLLATMHRGDAIAVASPCVGPLDYYLLRRGGRRIAEINASAGRGRVFVVVNPRHLQTLADVQAVRREFPWSQMVPDGPPVSFRPEFVYVFRHAAGS
jgi:Dolichyl-phosphate-mannose-protein mannosyltransferase